MCLSEHANRNIRCQIILKITAHIIAKTSKKGGKKNKPVFYNFTSYF